MNDLIIVKQLPIIEDKLKSISDEIDNKIIEINKLEVTEDTVKEVKKIRTDFGKDFKELEEKRKTVKNAILKPYEDFDKIYKQYVTDKFIKADIDLKTKIDVIENELKDKKEQEVREYFEEYKLSKNIDFIDYSKIGIKVGLSDSLKSLKDKVKQFIDKIEDDLNLIDTQEHKTEILVEYKQNLNVSIAITSVTNRFKAIEEEKRRQELFGNTIKKAFEEDGKVFIDSEDKKICEEDKNKIIDFVENAKERNEILQKPIVSIDEPVFLLKFEVKATKSKLQELKKFLNEGGYIYE